MVLPVAALAFAGCAHQAGPLFPPVDRAPVWPAPPERARVSWVGAIGSSDDLRSGRSGMEVLDDALHGRRAPIRFASPNAIAIAADGNRIAVSDTGASAVHIVDLSRRSHLVVTGWGDDERLKAPVGAAWLGERLFVTDGERREVIEFDAAGRHRGQFGSDVLTRPVGVAASVSRDALYVVDGGAHCVRVFNSAGVALGAFGQRGVGSGEFNFPSHIAVSNDGELYVADTGNFRVQVLGTDGSFRRSFGKKGDAAGDFSLPKGIALDSDGHVYVVDAQFENVQIFDGRGGLLLAFGDEGAGRGQLSLPSGVAIDARDRIWVSDAGNKRLQVFQYLKTTS